MGQELIKVLSEMIQLHQTLIGLSERKHDVIIERNMDGLTELMNSEKDLLNKLRSLEERRQQLTAELSGGRDHTLKDILGKLSPPVRRMVDSRALELKDQAEKLKGLNAQNEALLKDAMAFVHHMIGHLTAPPEQSITYGRPNQMKPAAPRGYFDKKA